MEDNRWIEVFGARENNLKNIDVKLPANKLVVITGLSGSGKSSLAFNTLYAEGQRRYIETFSAYARQFLGGLDRPDVDKIDGLSPVIAIEQKTTNRSPRSTVGTVTEIYDFLRLLYARIGIAYSYKTGEKMVQYTQAQILELIQKDYFNKKIAILAPVIKSRKGHYRELFQQLAKKGFLKVRVNGEITDITANMKLDRYKTHDIELVVDRLDMAKVTEKRLRDAVELAFKQGNQVLMIQDLEETEARYFSKNLMCPTTGLSYNMPEPNSFSFNSPKGACQSCNGLGYNFKIDQEKIIPDDTLSIKKGGILPLGKYKANWIFKQMQNLGIKHDFTLDTPLNEFTKDALNDILYGVKESFSIHLKDAGVSKKVNINFEGILSFIETQFEESNTASLHRWAKGFMNQVTCESCNGARLKKESLWFKVDEKSIGEVAAMSIEEFFEFISTLYDKLEGLQKKIGEEVIKEIKERTGFLLEVGLGYLNLNRSSKSLSGGEAQRIRLATQIGSQLNNVLYILDEPSIGLHQRDNQRLINSLVRLTENENSVIVVEHDKDMMLEADYLLEIGPRAGENGGEIVMEGKLEDILKMNTITTDYLSGKREIAVPKTRRKGNGEKLVLKGATGHNLQNVDIDIPLGKMICVTGVSGSGKSTLINETLYRILNQHFFNAVKEPLPYTSITGLDHLDKVIEIDQSPIGRTPRSNAVTYTGVFTDIRLLFSEVPEARIRGYKPGRFSFNVKNGRCETCKGSGLRVIEMNFLPDVYVDCETCQGKRFNRETLDIRYKQKSISDVLEMTIDEAVQFFEPVPKVHLTLKTLQDVGLGYIRLGQPATTLSGGEAQRVKLSSELRKKNTGKTFYILDEPTTGLHFEDVKVLMGVLNNIVELGNTVLVIEHNMDVIKLADHIIDIGPDGGSRGGHVVAEGTPEQIIKNKESITAHFLKDELS